MKKVLYPRGHVSLEEEEYILQISTLFILMDLSRHVDRISLVLPILSFKGSQVDIS